MPQAEGSIGASSKNLICTDHVGIVTMTTSIGAGRGLEVFSFVVGVETQPIQECES